MLTAEVSYTESRIWECRVYSRVVCCTLLKYFHHGDADWLKMSCGSFWLGRFKLQKLNMHCFNGKPSNKFLKFELRRISTYGRLTVIAKLEDNLFFGLSSEVKDGEKCVS